MAPTNICRLNNRFFGNLKSLLFKRGISKRDFGFQASFFQVGFRSGITPKIARSSGRSYFYDRYTKHIIEKYLNIRPAPRTESEAAKRGISVDFPSFAKWIADGNYNA